MIDVSVPYRGYSFFNRKQIQKNQRQQKFPSLTGVIRFLIDIVRCGYIGLILFPSLTGVIRFLMSK